MGFDGLFRAGSRSYLEGFDCFLNFDAKNPLSLELTLFDFCGEADEAAALDSVT